MILIFVEIKPVPLTDLQCGGRTQGAKHHSFILGRDDEHMETSGGTISAVDLFGN
jgi:hypothetical protein